MATMKFYRQSHYWTQGNADAQIEQRKEWTERKGKVDKRQGDRETGRERDGETRES